MNIRIDPEKVTLHVDKETGELMLRLDQLSLKDKKPKRCPPKKRTRVPKTLKDRLWETTFGLHAGSGPCDVCGTTIYARKFEAGHVVATACGGQTVLDNLRCICSDCNKSMGTMDLTRFKQKYFENDVSDVIEPCFLCGHETHGDNKYDSPYFECCGIRVHNSSNPEKHECLTEYFRAGIQLHGRRAFFLRGTNCPSCLEPQFGIIAHFEKVNLS